MADCFRCQAPAATAGGTPLCPDCFFRKIAKKSLGSARYSELLAQLWEEQQGRCSYTGITLQMGTTASLDHRLPTSRGGDHTRPNLQWVTAEANRLKANRTDEEFVQLVGRIAAYLTARRRSSCYD